MMTFPQSILDAQVDLMIDGAWTEITSDVYSRDSITITRGRSDEARQVEAGRCSLTLNNRDGKYSPRNPTGTYYGKIGRNTPIRVSVHAGTPALEIRDSVGDRATTPDHASLDITGDIDIRFDATLLDWAPSSATFLLGKYNDPTQRSWELAIQNGTLFLGWSTTGANFLERPSTVHLPIPPSRRLAVRATLDVNNGAAGHTVTFYTSTTGLAGPWTQLGDPVITAGVTSIFNSTSALEVGDVNNLSFLGPVGMIHGIEVRNGIGGSAVANPDFTAQAVGATSFVDGAGRTWAFLGNAAITNRHTRFVGEITAWPTKWDTSGTDIYTPIEAAGILRRLGQGEAPLDSTLRRRIPSFSPLGYWPMEDESGATRAASPIAGCGVLFTSSVSFGADDTLDGSKALPTVATGSRLNAIVPSGTVTTQWHTEFVYNLPTSPAAATTILGYLATGTVNRWTLQLQTGTATLKGEDADGTLVVNQTAAIGTDLFGDWNRYQFYAVQNGGNVDWTVNFINVGGGGGSFSGSYAGTVGRITQVVGPSAAYAAGADGLRLGHIAVFEDAGTDAFDDADVGFNGESALTRIDRIVEEEGVPLEWWDSDPSMNSERMGPQHPGTVLDILREAEAADHGILYESRESISLKYRDRISLYNQAVAASLDYSTDVMWPLEPVDDDQLVRNDIAVQRIGGSTGYAVLETGALSVLDPPNGVGRYKESVSLSLYSDDQVDLQAGWLKHVGTVDEARFPLVTVWLQRAPAQIDSVVTVDVGDRMQITDPGTQLPPGDIDLLVQGYTETIDQYQWEFQFNCTPASPYSVAVADDADLAKADTAGCTLNEALTTTETGADVAITDGPLWSTTGVPFDIVVGGERMTVTAVTGASSPQTLTVTRSVNGVVKVHSSGADVRLYQPAIVAL